LHEFNGGEKGGCKENGKIENYFVGGDWAYLAQFVKLKNALHFIVHKIILVCNSHRKNRDKNFEFRGKCISFAKETIEK
jgi:hypothetical protein